MIIFKKLRYRNFLSTGNIFTEIDLNKNSTTLIVGTNGAGKSTIIEALYFGLYGKPYRKVNKSLLINSINERELLVEIEFSSGTIEYLVRRGIKPNIFEIYQNGVMINQPDKVDDYQNILLGIIKIAPKSFAQIVILGTANFVPFMQMTAQHRRDFIEDLLDLGVFSNMNSLLKEKITTNKEALSFNSIKIANVLKQIEMNDKYIKSLQENNEEIIEVHKVNIQKINEEIHEYNERISILDKESSKIDLNLNVEKEFDLLKKQKTYEKIIFQLEEKNKLFDSEIQFFKHSDDCPTCHQKIDPSLKNDEIHSRLDKLDRLSEGLLKAKEELLIVQNDLNEVKLKINRQREICAEVQSISIDIQRKKTYKDSLEKAIDDLVNKTQKYIDTSESEKLNKELFFAENEKIALNKDKDLLNTTSSLLKDGGIKTMIIKQYIPVINKIINSYLSSLDFFVNFELDENFNETIRSRYRDEFMYENFSQGEKARIDLAILFAWRTIAKMRNSASTNLLILDEVFDGALDSFGIDELLKILYDDNKSNIFVISHKTDQMLEKFENVIKFEKIKNFSRII